MYVLGIETTCDETAAAVVQDGIKILSNIIFSQIDLHKAYGGVFPELASRSHAEKIIFVIDEALKKANVAKEEIGLIAVAKGPGLIGSLLVGLNSAKALSLCLEKPLIGVNHVEAHLYAAMMELSMDRRSFPALGLVLSGGHTFILKINRIGDYKLIATTVDDALGEAFDKVASMLDLPYPGGPEIEKLARKGDPQKYPFKAGFVKKNPLDFSFSGLKTSVLYQVKGQMATKRSSSIISNEDKKHIAASFQHAAFKDIFYKTKQALKLSEFKAIYLGGGVTNNRAFRDDFEKNFSDLPIFWPKEDLRLDNAAMIAGLGWYKFTQEKREDGLDLKPMTRIPLSS